MSEKFFEKPIINSPYEYPSQHWELDKSGVPTHEIKPIRRPADFVTPIPRPRQETGGSQQQELNLVGETGISTEEQQYDITAISIAHYPKVASRYSLTACGASLGDGYGPKVVAKQSMTME